MSKAALRRVVYALLAGISIIPVYGESTEQPENNAPGLFCLPAASYRVVAFDDTQLHNPAAGLTLLRYNPLEKDRLLAVSFMYSPHIASSMPEGYSNYYHNAFVSVVNRINRHIISGTFVARTDRPVYGGPQTCIAMAGYSNGIIQREHFSMNLGLNLAFMDIGVTLDNGDPWLIWPIPILSFSWDYDWFSLVLLPGIRFAIAPKSPVGVMANTNLKEFDVSLWYRYFGNGMAARLETGIGIKNDTTTINLANGNKYGINYNILYLTIRLLRVFEISGGWVFNGKAGEAKTGSDALLSRFSGYSGSTLYNNEMGDGFFVSVSVSLGL